MAASSGRRFLLSKTLIKSSVNYPEAIDWRWKLLELQ